MFFEQCYTYVLHMATKTPHLYRSRHGVYYLRLVLPLAEQLKSSKHEVWRSLKTKDAKQARGIALRFALEKNFADADMPKKSILDAITHPLIFTSNDGHTIDFDPDKPSEMAFASAFIAEQISKPSPAKPKAPSMHPQDLQRMRDSETEFRRLEALAQKKKSEPFSKYVHAYLTLIDKSKLTPRTKKAYTAKLKVFQDYIGIDATLEDITPEHYLEFQVWLATDDPATGRKLIAARSIDEYSNVVSNVYKKVIKKQAENPIEGRLVSKKERMNSKRKPFTNDELTSIFNPERLNKCKHPSEFFVPILGLLTGSRPSSICQLRVGDIQHDGKMWTVVYHDYLANNRAKTEATNRIVPLHTLLEKVGFLRYLEQVKQLPDSNAATLIFPYLNLYEQGYADVASQTFTQLLQQLKIHIHNVKVFYSLRHTTNQRMKQRGVTEDVRCQYIGHENDSVNSVVYGDDMPYEYLAEYVIPRLMFKEIDWDSIQYPEQSMETLEHLMVIAKRRDEKKAVASADAKIIEKKAMSKAKTVTKG